MTRNGFRITRRGVLQGLAAAALHGALPASAAPAVVTRPIGRDGERVPAIGMGTWLTFDIGRDSAALDVRTRVLEAFFANGGTLIDSSPMYRSAEEVVGRCLARLDGAPVFSATKVWKYGRDAGREAIEDSRRLWDVPRFDLLQIHNMLDWQTHLDTLVDMRKSDKLRYVGITTSHGRRHRDMQTVIETRPEFDAVQLTYNVTHRQAEDRLLPLAREHGLAVIVNRPFDGGGLFARVAQTELPAFAPEIECHNWAQLFLKFAISHPAVTCAIPATRRVDHMLENMGALKGPLPDADLRRRIVAAVERAR